jgi:hypothetical protein
VHRRFAPGIHFSWLTRDVALIWAVSALIAWLSSSFLCVNKRRAQAF